MDTEKLLNGMSPDWRVILVGDGAMALSELTEKGGCIDYYHYNAQPGIYYIRLLAKRFSHLVWLNPMPERSWDYIHGRSSIALLRQEVPMFPLSIDGLDRALKRLMVSR